MATVTDTERPPRLLAQSLALGLVFALALLSYATIRARDGRMPITDWLDPLLAGAVLLGLVAMCTALLALWPQLPSRVRSFSAGMVIAAQWTYITGEIVSNTITIGEPPSDFGSLLEMAAGGIALLAMIAMVVALLNRRPRPAMGVMTATAVLAFAMGWWFSHPIDQSTPGTPTCVPGNPIYNVFHGTSC